MARLHPGARASVEALVSAHENTATFGSLLIHNAGDISIVENAGTFLLWYETPAPPARLGLTLFSLNSNLERLVVRSHFIQLPYARQLLRTLSSPPDPLSFGRRFGHGHRAALVADRAAQADAG